LGNTWKKKGGNKIKGETKKMVFGRKKKGKDWKEKGVQEHRSWKIDLDEEQERGGKKKKKKEERER